jgi:hypothetical protein
MERRRHERHNLSAPVKFEWELPDRTKRHGYGVARNFSAFGLFVMTEDAPPVGMAVQVEMDLRTSTSDIAVTVRAKGRVERIEATDLIGELGGFAFSTRRMKLGKPDLEADSSSD